ncbi:MAG TPA: hypothetical protein VMT63_11030 [Bacteroidales bacterium]|nr:hypothetical protein [Bacteroidales bacterium]
MKTAFLSALLLVSVVASGQKGRFDCVWSKNPESAGSLTSDDYHSYRKGHILVYISNDDSCLYFDMKVPEIEDQNGMLSSGLTLWLSAEGKHHRTDGIRFPVIERKKEGPGQEGLPGQGMSPQGFNSDSFRNQQVHREGIKGPGSEPQGTGHASIEKARNILLIGFGSETPKIIPAGNKNGIRARFWYDKIQDLYLRISIPYSNLTPGLREIVKPGSPFTLGIEYGRMPSGNNGRGGMSGPTGGGMGGGMGRMGGGMRGGMGGMGGMEGMGGMRGRGGMHGGSSMRGGNGDYSSHQSATQLWISEIMLATK